MMNENTVPSVLVQEPEELELDLRDMLAALLLRWKTVLVWLLVAALLGFGFAMVKSHGNSEGDMVTEEEIAEKREKLSSNKAQDAERLFFQYVAYQELQRDLTAYYTDFVSTQRSMTEESVVRMLRKYYVTSRVENLGNLIGTFALTEADYDALREIFPDEEAGARVYDRVDISAWNSERITVSNIPGEEKAPIQYLFTLSLYGKSEELCEDMMQILDRAFRNELEETKVLDPQLVTIFISDSFDYDMLNYVTNLRKGYIDRITNADKEITDLNTRVSKLESDEKAYYDLLKKQYEQGMTTAKEEKVSVAKWTVIGAFLGCVIGVVVVLWPYLFDGKVKTADELESAFRSMVLNRVCVPGKKNLFGRWAAKLTGADDVAPAVKADMIAADLGVLMEKNGKNALYFLSAEEDAQAAALAGQVCTRLQAKNPDAVITVGNPLSAAAGLEALGAAELGVVFVELKQTRRALLRQWRQLCSRYRLPLAGSVTVQRCW